MKKIFLFFVIIFSETFFAQNCFPFSLGILEQYSNTADTIKPVYKDGGFSFINISSGKNIYPIHFQEAYPFFRDVAVVKYDDKYNVINRKGDFLIKEPIFDFIKGKPHLNPNYPNEVRLNNQYVHSYDAIKKRSEDESSEFRSLRSLSIYKSKNSKYGITCQDRLGELQFPAKYDTVVSVSENFILAKINGKYGLEDLSTQVIVPYEYDEVIPFNKQNKRNIQSFLGFRKGKHWFYFDWSGKLMVKTSFKVDVIASGSSEIIGAVKKDGTLGVLYKNGDFKDFKFDKVSESVNIGFIGNDIYFINDNKTISKYYSIDNNKKPDKIFISHASPYGDWSEVTIDKNFVISKNSKGEVVKTETDKNIWNSLIEGFDWCDYYSIEEAGNRTHVDGTDVVIRVCVGGLCFPKYTGNFYSGSEKMQNFYFTLEHYF